jgi:hypothetical protein
MIVCAKDRFPSDIKTSSQGVIVYVQDSCYFKSTINQSLNAIKERNFRV